MANKTTKTPAPNMNMLVTREGPGVLAFHFKDERLNEAARNIAANNLSIGANTAAIASVLGKVMDSKAYVKDGFKSVADFANKTFNMGKTSSYNAAKVGSRFINADTDVSKAVNAAALSMTALVRLLNVSDADIINAISTGELSETSSVKEVELFAQLHDNRAEKSGDSGKTSVIRSVYYAFIAADIFIAGETTIHNDTTVFALPDVKPSKVSEWYDNDNFTAALERVGIDSYYTITPVPHNDTTEYGKFKHMHRRFFIQLDNSGAGYAVVTMNLATDTQVDEYKRAKTRIKVTRDEYFAMVDALVKDGKSLSAMNDYYYET